MVNADAPSPRPPANPRLGPCRSYRRGLCRESEPATGTDHRIEQGGQLTTTTDVDNWPADADSVQGPGLIQHFHKHAERFGIEFIYDHIQTARLGERPFVLEGDAGSYSCDALIIATGASAQYLGLPSEAAFMGKASRRARRATASFIATSRWR